MRRSGVAAFGLSLVALAGWSLAPRASAQGTTAPTYVGAQNCKKCHLKEWKSWAATPMAKTFDSLKPGEKKEAKEKAKLDPQKDYTKEAACVRCHTTGYGEPGGYPKDGADQKLAAERQGVQCEVCHGPGSAYAAYMKDHEKDYKTEEAKKLGLVFSTGESCAVCHKGGPDGSPTMAADAKFDGAAKLKAGDGVHAHFKKH